MEMPRIAAKTVKEHRENIENALVDAAEEILRSQPDAELTAAAIASRAGIARSSIYRYVTSVNDLRTLVIERYMPRWMCTVAQATAGIRDPHVWLARWVWANLQQAATTPHGWLRSVMAASDHPHYRQPERCINNDVRHDFTQAGEDIRQLHHQTTSHLQKMWEKLCDDPESATIYTRITMSTLSVGFQSLDEHASLSKVGPIVLHTVMGMVPSEPADPQLLADTIEALLNSSEESKDEESAEEPAGESID